LRLRHSESLASRYLHKAKDSRLLFITNHEKN